MLAPRLNRWLLRKAGRETVWITLVALLLSVLAGLATFQVAVVEGASMEPTVRDGDYLLVDVRAYQRQSPARFDVIIFDYPADPRREFIKRVVGLPGETVRIHRGHVLIDGRALEESFHPVVEPQDFGPVTVPPGHLFVMGDNRPRSSDSRLWGPVGPGRIHGRAQWIVWPWRDASRLP